jgi:hypothetical protein
MPFTRFPLLPGRTKQGEWGSPGGQAMAAEMFFWLFGVAVLCFAFTLKIKPTAIVFV